MNIAERINRKIKKYYYDFILKPETRREFDEHIFLKELENEEKRDIFKKPILLMSYDDTSLMHKEELTYEYGGDVNSKLNSIFFNFIEKYPYVKHTLFFVPNPNYTKNGLTSKTITEDKFNIAKYHQDSELVKKIKTYSKKGVIEIALHGYNHINTKIKDYYSAFEFEFLTNDEAKIKIQKGLSEISQVFRVYGFKPPAWGIGQLNGKYYLLDVLKGFKFEYVCLSSPSNGLNYREKRASCLYPENINGLFNIPQNISILWNLQTIYKIIDLIVLKRGIINIQLHYTMQNKYIMDGLCDDIIEKLERILEYASKFDIDYALHKEVRGLCKKF